MALHGKHAKVLASKCSTPASSSLLTADQWHVKDQLEVIHSGNPSLPPREREWHPWGSQSLIGISRPDILQG